MSAEAFIAPIGDRSVILDLARDKYIGLGPKLTRIALNALPGAGSEAREQRPELSTQTELHSLGMLLGDGGVDLHMAPDASAHAPIETQWPSQRFGLGWVKAPRLTADALLCLSSVRSSLKRRHFSDTIDWLAAQRAKCIARPRRHTVEELLDSYFAARPWFPVPSICRLDAPALCLFLWRHGHPAALTFGVRLEPFAAHCWTQFGSRALNEPHESLKQFTPIMVV